MTYLLIIFVIALALAPLSHFVPSKRQRKVVCLREYAAVHGLFVEFRTLPGVKSGRKPPGMAGGDIIYYGRRLRPRRGEPVVSGSWIAEQGGWHSLDRRRAQMTDLLRQLPAGILAASVDEASCGIYWQEPGSEEDVERIRQVLEAWAEQLLN